MSDNLQILSWKKARNYVKAVDAQLANLIDNIDPGDEYKIYKVEYPWGQHLLREGILYLPNSKNQWVPLTDSTIDPLITEDLFIT